MFPNLEMAHHTFLRQLGLFTLPNFLSPEQCARLRKLADRSSGHAARVYKKGEARLDETHRKTLDVALSEADKREVEQKIRALRANLEQHFGGNLGGIDSVRCLVYGPGDFFTLHADAVESEKYDFLGRRRISVVIFLNDPNHPVEAYQGGQLSFYGLMNAPGRERFGFSADSETGLLVAFPATMLHEVSPITQGKRYTLVSWFFEKEQTVDDNADHDEVEAEAQGNG
jgi:predicted 2-oxoglutarate/Fe(II)-dependent dioxygenase YbiX